MMRNGVDVMRKFIITLLLVSMICLPTFGVVDKNFTEVEGVVYSTKLYIPLRKTFESLDYQVTWQPENQTVEIIKDNETLYVRTEEKYMLRNGLLIDGKVPPRIVNDRLYLSIDMVKEIFKKYEQKTGNEVRVFSGTKEYVGSLPKLKNKIEYEKLLSFYPEQFVYYETLEEDIMTMDMAPMEEKAASAREDVSETNTQVAGVDEADIVKIDENYIYALRNDKLQIISTGRGNLKVSYTVEENNFRPSQLFVKEDKLVLIGSETITELKTYEKDDRIITKPAYSHNTLMVKCYDISDLKNRAPKLIKSYGVEGNYLSSRLVEDYVYVVANQFTYRDYPIKPLVIEKENGHFESREISYEEVSYFPGHVNSSLLYTMGINLNDLSKEGLDINAYVGGGDVLYADKDTMYLALQSNSGMWWRDWRENTDIFSFNLDKGKVTYSAKGSVPGYIINQFSMDEYDGYFRIATTRWGSEDVTQGNTTLNNLYILNKNLEVVGTLENLAPGERIYSTRMMGDQVYMVTYRQVDPFYVIDTSEPTAPKVLGYLKIPGYSSYLHPYDNKTIIGVGMETKMVKDRVLNDGVKISLFDVTDFNNPIEKDKVILGTGNSSTDVSYDHKAF